MTQKRNIYLFYSYFAIFLFFTSVARNFLTPLKQAFPLDYQLLIIPTYLLLSIPFLIIIAKNCLYNKRAISWLAFSLIFIFFWELSNYLPLIGFALASYIHHSFQITLPIDTAPVIFRYVIMLASLFFARKYILLFFSALLANKKGIVNKTNFMSENSHEVFFSPNKSLFLFNDKTGILSLVYQKKDFLFSTKHFLRNEDKTFFTPINGKKNPPLSTLKIKDNILFIKEGNTNFTFLMSKLPETMRKTISQLVTNNYEQDVVIIGGNNQLSTKNDETTDSIHQESEQHIEQTSNITNKPKKYYDEDTMVVTKN